MSQPVTQDLDLLCINTLRTLAIDQVQRASSGHPGTPMGAAPTAYCLWQRFLRFDPEDAAWPNRDRFVLSVGHASALLYGLLHLCGVKAATSRDRTRDGLAVAMADLQSFRQAGSRCTGHPEHGWTTGVETTTGPLGQGVATSVGMAIAQAWLAASYNRPGFALFDHRVFALAGDGDMMEGLSAEAASLAGHLKLAWLLGGAADLAPSTKTPLTFDFAGTFEPPACDGIAPDIAPVGPAGRNLHFGVRAHAMCAVASGMALSGLRPFAASFLVFADYCRGAIRLAAMMGLPVIYVWTHDSIAMGEDGPTHQPVEQLTSFRAMPGMAVLRPADANEVTEAWRVLMQLRDRPASLVLSRQALPTLDRNRYAGAEGVARGAYVLADAADGRPDVLLLASGSEVALCIAAYEQLLREGIKARVVSMPSWDLFERQDEAYRERVLPAAVAARVSVEAASPLGWDRYVGRHGAIIAMRSFGLSAPGAVAQAHFGFDVAQVLAAARRQLDRQGREAPA